jgi:hypothetical protein
MASHSFTGSRIIVLKPQQGFCGPTMLSLADAKIGSSSTKLERELGANLRGIVVTAVITSPMSAHMASVDLVIPGLF